MPAIVRKNDKNEVNAIVTTGVATTVFVNSLPVALKDSNIAPHSPGGIHNTSKVLIGSATVQIEGKAVAYVGSLQKCGHKCSTGSPNVQVGGSS